MKQTFLLLFGISIFLTGCVSQQDPLASWNEGVAKQSVFEFVLKTTSPHSPDFVEEEDRIAVFDNDGTLWSEQPMYFQLAFVMDRLNELAPAHPEWKTTQPYKAALEKDMKTLHDYGEEGLIELL
ncbi:MAG: haloacid dehalogenase-like hydrolase, partial [Planctomycetota bacterium]